VMREVERQVMLRIIDQRWREHLEEMDYLKEGINLRAMGQKDPLTEWQREGFEMFGAMMKGIAQDFVRYVMHVQVKEQEQPKLEPKVLNLQTTSSDNAPQQSGFSTAAAVAAAEDAGAPAATAPAATSKPQTVTKDAFEKTPRNAPCPCGSGKKFKQCHGAA
jgi:preprotein translocase subunit SecA